MGSEMCIRDSQLLMQTKEVSNNRRSHKASSKECGGGGNWAQISAKCFSIFCAGLPQAQQSKPMQKGETNATKPQFHKNKVMNDNDNNVMNDSDSHYFEG